MTLPELDELRAVKHWNKGEDPFKFVKRHRRLTKVKRGRNNRIKGRKI